jgi:hypothetical protein
MILCIQLRQRRIPKHARDLVSRQHISCPRTALCQGEHPLHTISSLRHSHIADVWCQSYACNIEWRAFAYITEVTLEERVNDGVLLITGVAQDSVRWRFRLQRLAIIHAQTPTSPERRERTYFRPRRDRRNGTPPQQPNLEPSDCFWQ